MFVEKTPEEFEAMTPKEQAEYLIAQKEHNTELRQKEIKDALEKFKSENNSENKEAIEKLEKESERLKEALIEQGIRLKAISEIPKNSFGIEDVSKQVADFISDNASKIAEMHKDGKGVLEIEIKAVGTITTANGVNTSPPAITGTQQAPLSNVNLRTFDVVPLTTNVPTQLAAYPYTESVPKDGDYSFVAEGGTKPQIDFSWETNYAKPVKAAAWIKLTEESIQDVKGLQSVANDYLRRKHNLKKTRGILFGDGVAPNPKGATEYGRLFVAGDMANAVADPNMMDVINAAITDIFTTHNFTDEEPYMANLVMLNPIDFFLNFVSAKDGEGRPLYPTATLFNQVVIGGVTIIPDEMIPSGKIFVSDMSKYNTTDYISYNVKIGWVNDDFINNQFVILGESRFHAFVKKLDEQAFIYDDIATIKTAITTL